MPSSPSNAAEPPASLARLIARPFAHRGLHGPGIVENSLAAFRAAIDAGMGIELDVRASADGRAIVFHDATLGRLADGSGALAALDSARIAATPLRGSSETIPLFDDALALVDGQVPILVELKTDRGAAAGLCEAVHRSLAGYPGLAAPMSFNPDVGHWFARHDPARPRGLVVTEGGRRWRGGLARRIAAWRARPHFLAYDIRDLPSRFAARQRARGRPILTWTCRSEADRALAAVHADQVIHEFET